MIPTAIMSMRSLREVISRRIQKDYKKGKCTASSAFAWRSLSPRGRHPLNSRHLCEVVTKNAIFVVCELPSHYFDDFIEG